MEIAKGKGGWGESGRASAIYMMHVEIFIKFEMLIKLARILMNWFGCD